MCSLLTFLTLFASFCNYPLIFICTILAQCLLYFLQPCLAEFTPDGSSLIIAGMNTDISYSNESDKQWGILLHTIPLAEMMPGYKPLRQVVENECMHN